MGRYHIKASSCCVGLLGVALAMVAESARANEPATANSVNVGLGFRYGFELEEGDFNPWGNGIGVEVGFTMPNALYVGGNVDYFFGDSETGPDFELSSNIWQAMGEVGYDVGVAPAFVLRPKLGAGIAGINTDACLLGVCEDDSETYFAMAPGSTFLFFTERIVIALDFRYDMIFAEEETANALLFSAGIGF